MRLVSDGPCDLRLLCDRPRVLRLAERRHRFESGARGSVGILQAPGQRPVVLIARPHRILAFDGTGITALDRRFAPGFIIAGGRRTRAENGRKWGVQIEFPSQGPVMGASRPRPASTILKSWARRMKQLHFADDAPLPHRNLL